VIESGHTLHLEQSAEAGGKLPSMACVLPGAEGLRPGFSFSRAGGHGASGECVERLGAMGNRSDRRRAAVAAITVLALVALIAGCATHRGAGAPNPPTDDAGLMVPAGAETLWVLAHPPTAEELPLPTILSEPYRIALNDVLTVHVLANPGLTAQTRVRPDGKISVPGVGEISAAGRQPSEIADEVETALSRLLLHPDVTVIVDNFGPFLVYVLGEVQRPGSIEVRREMTVLGAIAAAGGATDKAQLGSVALIRRFGEGEGIGVKLDLRGAMSGEDLSKDVAVQMYDIVVVPRSFIARMETFMSRFFVSAQRPFDVYLQGWEAFNTDRVYYGAVKR
jgi:polysaccharide export outer membrane protein